MGACLGKAKAKAKVNVPGRGHKKPANGYMLGSADTELAVSSRQGKHSSAEQRELVAAAAEKRMAQQSSGKEAMKLKGRERKVKLATELEGIEKRQKEMDSLRQQQQQ